MANFVSIKGTTVSSFQIGKNGPLIQQGTLDPNASSVPGNTGDLYIRYGASAQLWQYSGLTWVQVTGSGSSTTSLYVQDSAPSGATPPYIWIQTNYLSAGNFTVWFNDGL